MPADLPMQEAEVLPALPRREVPPMTLADLQAECWAALPPIRKRMVGRDTVNDFVALAVENWAGEYLGACQDNQQRDVYVHALLNHLKRGHQLATGREPAEYGFIWAFLLQAVAVAVVQWLVKWWLDRRANRALMAVWQHELTK
jgi:hypothetical protein